MKSNVIQDLTNEHLLDKEFSERFDWVSASFRLKLDDLSSRSFNSMIL